ncbi:unnamed protein product [Cylindrotheca closterium]|uniref:Uncharacterized protein n=1 Tax=Cylindrotheca closterium TaxID=2856 RepID=A0AAD2CGH2_9STRA|nr:unnamed protein product [Cylindrotheca closterium]
MSAIHYAARDGDWNLVNSLLHKGVVDVDERGEALLEDSFDPEQVTALHISCDAGHLKISRLLLDRGADLNAKRDLIDLTPLHGACNQFDLAGMYLLLAYGADLEARWTHAIELGLIVQGSIVRNTGFVGSSVRLLVERGVEVNRFNTWYETPLNIACQHQNLEMMRLLLEGGANIEMTNDVDETHLHHVCEEGYLESARLLLDSGANLEAKNADDDTPLGYACGSGKGAVARLLVDRGANVNALSQDDTCTPLLHACRGGHVEIVQLLLDHHADIEAEDCAGHTALHVACEGYQASVADVRLLLDRRANIEARTPDGYTPLHIACQHTDMEIVRLLLGRGAAVQVRTAERGMTSLLLASEKRSHEVVWLLIRRFPWIIMGT